MQREHTPVRGCALESNASHCKRMTQYSMHALRKPTPHRAALYAQHAESTLQYGGNGGSKRNAHWRARDYLRTPALCRSKTQEEIIIQHIDTRLTTQQKSVNAECPTAAAGIHRTRVADTAHRFSRITSCYKQHNKQGAGHSLERSKMQEEIIQSTHSDTVNWPRNRKKV